MACKNEFEILLKDFLSQSIGEFSLKQVDLLSNNGFLPFDFSVGVENAETKSSTLGWVYLKVNYLFY